MGILFTSFIREKYLANEGPKFVASFTQLEFSSETSFFSAHGGGGGGGASLFV